MSSNIKRLPFQTKEEVIEALKQNKGLRLHYIEYQLLDESDVLALQLNESRLKTWRLANNQHSAKQGKVIANHRIRELFLNDVADYIRSGNFDRPKFITELFAQKEKLAIFKLLYGDTDKGLLQDIDDLKKATSEEKWIVSQFNIIKSCFTYQSDFLQNELVLPITKTMASDNQFMLTLLGSRRAGKTESNIRSIAFELCQQPYESAIQDCVPRKTLYIHNKPAEMQLQMFDPVCKLLADLDAPIAHVDHTHCIITMKNGNIGRFVANTSTRSITDLQGDKYTYINIDESQSQRWLYEGMPVLTPMLTDSLTRGIGRLVLSGTPPRRAGTFFEDQINNSIWRHIKWTAKDNPIYKGEGFDIMLKSQCDLYNCGPEDPRIQREVFGNIVYDTDALIFKQIQTWSEVEDLKLISPDTFIIGMDYADGEAEEAVIGYAFNHFTLKGFVYYEDHFKVLSNEKREDSILKAWEAGKAITNTSRGLIVEDVNNSAFSKSMTNSHGWQFTRCKGPLTEGIERLQEGLRSNILLIKDGYLHQETKWTLLKRNEVGQLINEIDDDSYHPDGLMALMYINNYIFKNYKEKK